VAARYLKCLPWKRQARYNHLKLLCTDKGTDLHGMLAHFLDYWDGETGQHTVFACVEWAIGAIESNSAYGRECFQHKMLTAQDSDKKNAHSRGKLIQRMLIGHDAYC
jgi:hypothetical protein